MILPSNTHRGQSVLISKASWMNFGQAQDGNTGRAARHPNEVCIWHSFSVEPWSIKSVYSKEDDKTFMAIALLVKYPLGHPLKPKKLRISRKSPCFCLMITSSSTETLQSTNRLGDDSNVDDVFCDNIMWALTYPNRCLRYYQLAGLLIDYLCHGVWS